jgi:hypothetical protein
LLLGTKASLGPGCWLLVCRIAAPHGPALRVSSMWPDEMGGVCERGR